MADDFAFWRNVPVIYEDAQGRRFYGDVPCVRYNDITDKFEPVDNPRGNAYAARLRMKYRKKKM